MAKHCYNCGKKKGFLGRGFGYKCTECGTIWCTECFERQARSGVEDCPVCGEAF